MAGELMLVRPRWRAASSVSAKATLFKMLADGRLPRVKINRRSVGIPMTAIKALAEGRGTALPRPAPTPEPMQAPQPLRCGRGPCVPCPRTPRACCPVTVLRSTATAAAIQSRKQ